MKVIINIDDYGLSPSTNESIIALAKEHKISSTTILTTRSGNIHNEIASLRDNCPQIGCGVHLDLDSFFKFDENNVYGTNEHDIVANYEQITNNNIDDITFALHSQIQMVKSTGIQITHVDSHHSIHQFPFLLPTVLSVMDLHGIKKMRFANNFYRIDDSYNFVMQYLTASGILSPDYFFALPELMSNGNILDCASGIIEIMAHTSLDDNSLGCVEQYNFLKDLDVSGFELITFGEL